MLVLQINVVYGEKSTGRTCSETEKALLKHGIRCVTAFRCGKTNSKNAFAVNTLPEFLFHTFMSRLTGLEGYFSFFATKRLVKKIKKLKPDVIHLRNIHGHYLNFPVLFSYLKKANIPVIQNLHDVWATTGKCSHNTAYGCEKWKTECGKCPAVKSYPKSWFFDFSHKMRKDKEKWYGSVKNLKVIGVSDWVTEVAKKSFFKNREILRIYNWINTDVFKPYEGNVCEKYGIDKNKFTVIDVSNAWKPELSKYSYALRLADVLPSDVQLVLVGGGEIHHKNIKQISYISDTTELARLYSSVDCFVHLTDEEAFGKVIAEAMACGLPAVVFNSTACGELVKEGCGYAVERGDVNALLNGILKVKANGKEKYSRNCIEKAQRDFNYEKNTDMLKEVYEKLASKNQKGVDKR